MGFEKLENIAEIDVSFETLSSLHIGAGEKIEELTETPVIKLNNRPVIPGSSLKGALRSTIESVLSNEEIAVCVPSSCIPRDVYRIDDKRKAYLSQLKRIEPCEPKKLCPICDIFGTAGSGTGMSGHVVCLDAVIEDVYDPSVLLERTHVAIERQSRAQSKGALVTSQSVDSGVIFKGMVRVFNYKKWQVGALLVGFEWLKKLGVGAKKNSGYGQLKISVNSVSELTFKQGKWSSADLSQEGLITSFYSKIQSMERYKN